MEELLQILNETQIPFAYHHFAEGESPEPPFICYLLPRSNNFSGFGFQTGSNGKKDDGQ